MGNGLKSMRCWFTYWFPEEHPGGQTVQTTWQFLSDLPRGKGGS